MKLDKQNLLKHPPSSYWMDSTRSEASRYPQLKADEKADVVIVGGGITGITTAYLLSRQGLSVILLEAERICGGTTGYTTAKITSQHNLIYDKLIKKMGRELAQQYADANETAIKEIKTLTEQLNIPCDFTSESAFVYTESDDYIKAIHDEVDAATKLGIKAAYAESIPFPFTIKGAVRFDNQAQFHPLKYALSLAKAFTDNGGKIYENTRVMMISDDKTHSVTTERNY